HPMSFYYGYAHIVPVELYNIQSIISILIHLSLFFAAIFFLKKHPILSFGIIFYLVSIAVFSNLLHSVVGMMADRFTYAASLGFCIVVGYSLMKIFKMDFTMNKTQIIKPAFIITLTLLLAAYSYQTISRNALWKNQLTLMRHDIKHLENSV